MLFFREQMHKSGNFDLGIVPRLATSSFKCLEQSLFRKPGISENESRQLVCGPYRRRQPNSLQLVCGDIVSTKGLYLFLSISAPCVLWLTDLHKSGRGSFMEVVRRGIDLSLTL